MVENANQGENDLDIKQAERLSYMINTLLLSFVIIMMLLFVKFEATFLVYFSIPTILVYIINYILIHKSKLVMFVWLVYFWIALYMGATTVCLGYGTGFHLYVISLIPVCFYMEYMSYKLQGNKIRAGFISIILVIFYIVSSGFALIKGAVYPIVEAAQVSFMTVNALIVFSFIIGYTALLNKIVIKSENELKDIALSDRLTGLYNRHYMIEQINSYINGEHKSAWLAMADLDKFKEINDMFGHNAGDYVLVQAGNKMRDICRNCTTEWHRHMGMYIQCSW